MLKTADTTNYFSYKREEGQNPNTGFMSFQHFNGEEIYSDIVVRPENNMTETENVECYPIPSDVPQNGSREGYYPKDTTIVYIRVLWKEWEPEQGKYNYAFIQDILDKAKAHNQTLTFRLMAHSTRARDDVPEWLKGLMECPERPDGKRVKDSPTDPLFIELFGKAISELGKAFDENPTFDTMDISLPGAWGEGHNLHLYPKEDLEKLFDIYTDSFKHTRLIGQVFKPELIERALKKCSVGIRGDGFGSPFHVYEKYPPAFERLSGLWQTAPVSFEAFWWLCEWQRQGWDIDEMIQVSLSWHISSFNAKSIPVPFEWKEKIDYWISKMGYHFAIDYFKFPFFAEKGDNIELKVGIDNVGVAPMYDKIPLYVRLKGEDKYEFKTEADVTKWLPGKINERILLELPENIKAGKYEIQIGIFGVNYNLVYFATDAKRDGQYYSVGNIEIK